MKFKITKASDWAYEAELDIKTFDELMAFVAENGDIIVGNYDFVKDVERPTIKIYDDYVE